MQIDLHNADEQWTIQSFSCCEGNGSFGAFFCNRTASSTVQLFVSLCSLDAAPLNRVRGAKPIGSAVPSSFRNICNDLQSFSREHFSAEPGNRHAFCAQSQCVLHVDLCCADGAPSPTLPYQAERFVQLTGRFAFLVVNGSIQGALRSTRISVLLEIAEIFKQVGAELAQ